MSKNRKHRKTAVRKAPAHNVQPEPTDITAKKRTGVAWQPKKANFLFGMALIKPSIAIYRQNLAPALALMLLPSMCILLGTTLADGNVATWPVLAGGLLVLVCIPWSILNALAAYRFTLLAARGEHPKLWPTYRFMLRYIPRLAGLGILASIVVVLGFICLIIPGFMALRRYVLAPYYLVDRDLGIREAMQASAAASQAESFKIYGVIAAEVVLTGAATLFGKLLPPYTVVAGLVATTLYVFAPALMYEYLNQKAATRRSEP